MPPDPPVALAVNPTSGSGRGAAVGARAADLLRAAGIAVQPFTAADAPALRERAAAVIGAGVRALVVVGGDGMVNLGVNLLACSGVPLGIVAAGTGNDIARELGSPVDNAPDAAVLEIIAALRQGHPRAVDAVRWSAEGSDGASGWFIGVLGAGFDSIVNERANRWRWLPGRLRYDLAILRELPVFTPRHYTLDLDGRRSEPRAVLVAVGNGPAYGGGMRICAGALSDDGLLDVVVAGPLSRRSLIRLYPKVYRGTHLAHPAVGVRRARRVRIDAPGIVAYADGERLAPLPLTCEVIPGAVRLLAIASTPAVTPSMVKVLDQ